MTPFREQVAELDRALTERGFVRQNAPMQVVWRARWNGRDCVVRAAPQRRTKYAGEVRYRTTLGYRLRAELETSVRTQLFFVRDVQTGLVWFAKILTDPFHDVKIYHRSPLLWLKGERIDPMRPWPA